MYGYGRSLCSNAKDNKKQMQQMHVRSRHGYDHPDYLSQHDYVKNLESIAEQNASLMDTLGKNLRFDVTGCEILFFGEPQTASPEEAEADSRRPSWISTTTIAPPAAQPTVQPTAQPTAQSTLQPVIQSVIQQAAQPTTSPLLPSMLASTIPQHTVGGSEKSTSKKPYYTPSAVAVPSGGPKKRKARDDKTRPAPGYISATDEEIAAMVKKTRYVEEEDLAWDAFKQVAVGGGTKGCQTRSSNRSKKA